MRIDIHSGREFLFAKAYLDGCYVEQCVAADDIEGWVETRPNESRTIRQYGQVRIDLPTEEKQ